MLAPLRTLVTARQRVNHCRRHGHAWTDMAEPPACMVCGRTRRSDGLERADAPQPEDRPAA
jgi:hypothetical protein